MKVWIVLFDSSDQYDPAASWSVERVFDSQMAAEAFAAQSIYRKVEEHDIESTAGDQRLATKTARNT